MRCNLTQYPPTTNQKTFRLKRAPWKREQCPSRYYSQLTKIPCLRDVKCGYLGPCFYLCARNPTVDFALVITWEVVLLPTNAELVQLIVQLIRRHLSKS